MLEERATTTDKPASEMSASELWGTVTGVRPLTRRGYFHCVVHGKGTFREHSDCPVNDCPYGCGNPVTNGQINDGDAFPIDERGPDDQRYAHRECAQGARCEP